MGYLENQTVRRIYLYTDTICTYRVNEPWL